MYFPHRKICVNKSSDKKWVNEEVRASSTKLKNIFILKKICPNITEAYNIAKKNHSRLIKDTKKCYYQNKIIHSDNPARSAWKVVAELSNKNKSFNNIIINNNDGVIHEHPQIVASLFNEFFIETPKNIIEQTPPGNTCIPTVVKQTNSLFLKPFTTEEMLKLLTTKFKAKKSSGPDDIPCFLIKKVLNFIVEPLTYLVNLSFETGTFPNSLKIGKVVPIFKKNDKQLLENYRPVTVPFGMSKVIEYCYLYRLLNYLETFQIMTKNQHGFSSGKSTSTAIHSFLNKILECVDAGECPVGIFCDLSRAFDCVNHNLLLIKLQDYGIRGPALNWVTTFLEGRKQYVTLNHKTQNNVSRVDSECLNLTMGVPQGSILGPVLFLLYVNDIDSLPATAHFTMYADDISVIISNPLDNVLEQNCNNILSILSSWFSYNTLHFNAEKTHLTRFHSRQKKCDNLNININNTPISSGEESIKFLGVYLDESLNWNYHCETLISKISSIVYLFRNIRAYLSREQLISLYYAQIDTRLRYGVCFWGNSTLSSKVFIAQKRILRCIADVPSAYSCKNIFKDFKILSLPSLYIFEICIYVFMNRNNFILNKDCHNVNTRQKNKLHEPCARLNMTSKSPRFIGPKIFNRLPDEIKCSKTVHLFKKRLKLFLLDKCYYSVSEFFVS